MPLTPKILANGQFAATKTTIYTTPASTTTYVRRFAIFNSGANTENVKIYIKVSAGTSRLVDLGTLLTGERADVDLEYYTLSAGDVIEAQTTTASAVDYIIAGAEQT